MSDKPKSVASNGAIVSKEKMPGRTVGFVNMFLMIVAVAVILSRYGEPADSMPAASVDQSLDGFRSDAWMLPDEEMLGFVEIPAGTFTMGSNPALDRMAYENERWSSSSRQGVVDLPTFYISRYEVTIAQFRAFAEATGLPPDIRAIVGPGDYPVANITWPEALAYGRWLQRQLKQSTQTPAALKQLLQAGARLTLPSEAEWEKAARSVDGRVFPWGSQPQSGRANFASSAVVGVGSMACDSCAYGLSDMSGNVWELTRSPLQDYPYDAADDRNNLADDALWVMRGGSYADAINNVRAAVRGGVDPGVRSDSIGFRLVITTL
ncbi:MAG: SUMF1/EgtB/PvdO family nonheme iron enzyme [Proteobacteria bacterium]|nr:SUMF1/EgtB/PvdO family nonheme iron enzyme [Pseudomonadota bacterium]